MRDAALDWLQEHDPESIGISGREYARRVGVIPLQVESGIWDSHEQASDSLDFPFHCPACRRKSNMMEHAVD